MRRVIMIGPMSLWLGGCMMSGVGGMGMGSGGMHGAMGRTPAGGPLVVKETVTGGMRLTVEFPPYRLGDSLRYTLALQEAESRAPVLGAMIALFVSPTDSGAPEVPEHATAHAGRDATPPSAPLAPVTELEQAATELGNGRYAFRPSITTAGTYRMRFVVRRGATPGPEASRQLEHVVTIRSPENGHGMADANGADAARWTPLVVLGAGAMAIAMLFMVR